MEEERLQLDNHNFEFDRQSYLWPRKLIPQSCIQKDLIKNEYGIKYECATTKNPHVNSIFKRFHQATAKLVYTFDLQNIYLDKDNFFAGTIVATDFLVQCTNHSMLEDSCCLDVTLK